VQADLVVLALGGVQRFIGESRTTADVAGASEIVQELARYAATVAHERMAGQESPFGLVIPAPPTDPAGHLRATNKIVVLAPSGAGQALARELADAVRARWAAEVATRYPDGHETPGFPDVSWVRVTGSAAEQDYEQLWDRANAALVARRRVRAFEPLLMERQPLCGLAPNLPAGRVPAEVVRLEEQRSQKNERRRGNGRLEFLSAAGWIKRLAGRQGQSFPSTVSVASTSFRARLITAASMADADVRAELVDTVRRLDTAVVALDALPERRLRIDAPADLRPLTRHGAWVLPERWEPESLTDAGITADRSTISQGRGAAVALGRLAERLGVPGPTPYYAVVVQDLDRLGRALSGLGLAAQREVSRELADLAQAQRAAATDMSCPAAPVYAGGDDFLAFCPAASALELAGALRRLVDELLGEGPLRDAGQDGGPVTASTAVVFAHMTSPMQEAITAAQQALKLAKDTPGWDTKSRDALAVVVRRRGGERAKLIQPWRARAATVDLAKVQPESGGALSPGLASRLEADRQSFGELTDGQWPALEAELRRLVKRQGGTTEAADALYELALRERSGGRFDPVPAALVARFLTQECR